MRLRLLYLALIAGPVIFAQNIPNYLPADSLVAWFPFNGNANDESGNGNHLTSGIGTFPTPNIDRTGNANSAYSFDGDSSFLETHIPFYNAFTISLWTKHDIGIISSSWDDKETIFAYGDNQCDKGVLLGVKEGSSKFNFGSWCYSSVCNTTLDTNWHLLVVLYDGSTLKLIRDTTQIAVRNNISLAQNDSIFRIGKNLGPFTEVWDGVIDDVGYWNKILSPTELIGLYNFSDCSGSIQSQPVAVNSNSGNAVFTVKHSDASASYQWQENNGTVWSNLVDFGVYSGTSSDSLVLTGATNAFSLNLYRCIVGATCYTDTTNSVILNVCTDSIQNQPQSNTFFTSGGTAFFGISHTDTAATFQWQVNNGTGWSNLTNFGAYSGSNTDSLVITGISSSMNNYGFRCLIDACNMDTTDVAILTVVDNIGVNEIVKDIIVSPNPTSGLLIIVLTSSAEYEVFNINGQRVAQGTTEGQIDITNLPTGSYQLIINNDDGRSTHTIQKI